MLPPLEALLAAAVWLTAMNSVPAAAMVPAWPAAAEKTASVATGAAAAAADQVDPRPIAITDANDLDAVARRAAAARM